MKTVDREFYIGWQEQAPSGVAHWVKKVIMFLSLAVSLLGALLVLDQRGFADSIFEFGKLTQLEGVLIKEPAPFLQVYWGNNLNGEAVFQNVLLVARGKHGISQMLESQEYFLNSSLDGKTLRLTGFLIYHDGKTLMEVEEMKEIKVLEGTTSIAASRPVYLGSGAFIGEVTDPKCLFGVMKPGFGKPHRSCAARCIAGGIPPVLKTFSQNGESQYYLLAGASGEAINSQVLPFVADQVVVCGQIYKMGEWLFLYKDAGKDFTLLPSNYQKAMVTCW